MSIRQRLTKLETEATANHANGLARHFSTLDGQKYWEVTGTSLQDGLIGADGKMPEGVEFFTRTEVETLGPNVTIVRWVDLVEGITGLSPNR